jgi:beta-phosphoglucomutase-like phosphatase (HAD superfamily)
MLELYKNVIWDFDGVIIDSMPIRGQGFEEIFKDFAAVHVEELMRYHRANGGLSRFVKIRYFFEVILDT